MQSSLGYLQGVWSSRGARDQNHRFPVKCECIFHRSIFRALFHWHQALFDLVLCTYSTFTYIMYGGLPWRWTLHSSFILHIVHLIDGTLHTHMHAHTHTHAHIYHYTHIKHSYTQVRTYTCVHTTYMYVHVQFIITYIRTCITS